MTCRNAAAAIPLLTLLWSCGNDPVGVQKEGDSNPVISSTGPSTEVFLSPGFLVLARGQEAQMELRVERGSCLDAERLAEVSWHSTAPEVATVSPEGLVRALGPGTARIRVTGDDLLASASVRVR